MKSEIVSFSHEFVDDRGAILSLVNEAHSNVSIIKCFEGSIRANHWHLDDHHYMYVISGRMDYFYVCKDENIVKYFEVCAGQMVFTPKLELHATHYPVDTDMVVISKNRRDRDTYEADTRRIAFLDLENLQTLKNGGVRWKSPV